MYMFRKLNFWPLPKAPGGRDPKNCAGACAIHVSNSNTKSGWISEKIFFWPPSPPRYAQVPPLGMTQAAKWKSRLICFISFICEKIYKVWFKNLWNWLCNSDLMIFDLLAPPQGPRGQDQKHGAGACAIHVRNSHTKSGWISGKIFFDRPNPPRYPQVRPLGHDPGCQMKIPSDMFYIFHVGEDTQSLVKKSFKLTL